VIDRYTLAPMKEHWTLQAQYERWLEVELAALTALEEHNRVPAGTSAAVKKAAHIDLGRIEAIEQEIGHDLLAFLRSLEEQVGEVGRFIHHGLTSSDVKDTALSLQMRDALALILKEATGLVAELRNQARQYQDLVMVGRTHGLHAEPTTLGLKFFLWSEEMSRNIERLKRAKETISVGKFSGPVGTYSQIAPEVEAHACRTLDLQPASVSSQILQRDRHAEVLAAIAITAATLEKIALEIRHLSRTEIGEVEEPRPEGSSSMPHKRNPITCERICGLARVLRGNLQPALENIALWHERDMSHSSVERIIIPDGFTLIHYMLVKMTGVISGLVIHEEKIQENLERSRGAIYSQAILLKLVERGMTRQDAHAAVETAAKQAFETGRSFLSVLKETPQVGSLLKQDDLNEASLSEDLRTTSRRIISGA